MSRRAIKFAGLVLALVVVAAGGFWWWRMSMRSEILVASLPPRPALSGFPSELSQRVAACEQRIKSHSGGIAPLAELAQLYHANGFPPEAAQCYRGLLRADPSNPRWPHRLAAIYADAGQLEEALTLWQQVTALAPDYLPARLRTGDVLLKLNRQAEAAAAYTSVTARETANPFALLGLARIDIGAQRWSEARPRLELAAGQSDYSIGGDLLATVYEHVGETGQAAAIRGRAKSAGAFYDPPDPWMEEIFENCYDVYRLGVVGGFANHRGDTQAALHWFERAVTLAPDDAQTHFAIGMLELQLNDLAKAREQLETCTTLAPDFSDGWAQLSGLFVRAGDNAAAARTLAQGLLHCPRSPGLHLDFARRLAQSGQTKPAVDEYQAVIRLRPEEAGPYVELAMIWFQADQVNEGLRLLQGALLVEPEYPTALSTLALYSINAGDEAAARQWLHRVDLQVRVPPAAAAQLHDMFIKRFGHAPEP